MHQVLGGQQQSVGGSFDGSSVISVRTCNPGTSKIKSEDELDDKKNNELGKLKYFLDERKKEHPIDKKPTSIPSVGLLQALDTNPEVNLDFFCC